MENLNIKIIVCVHKPDFYDSDLIYIPLHVGKSISNYNMNIQVDNIGDNISERNRSYCELTGLYWAWKNLNLKNDVDYIGLCHYRRYFNFRGSKHFIKSLSKEQYLRQRKKNMIGPKHLKNCDIILPKPITYPYNLFLDYSFRHVSDDMRIVRDVIHLLTPEYDDAFDKIMFANNNLSCCNMFICNWNIFDEYCRWLFEILAALEKRIDIRHYNAVQSRIFGYIGERLLNVFVEHHKLRKKYYPIVMIDELDVNRSVFKYYCRKLKNNAAFFFSKEWSWLEKIIKSGK